MIAKLSSKTLNKSDNGTLTRSMPSFEKKTTKHILKMPRGYMRDSDILHHLLHIVSLGQLQPSIIAGFLFEAFVLAEIALIIKATLQLRSMTAFIKHHSLPFGMIIKQIRLFKSLRCVYRQKRSKLYK